MAGWLDDLEKQMSQRIISINRTFVYGIPQIGRSDLLKANHDLFAHSFRLMKVLPRVDKGIVKDFLQLYVAQM